SFNQGRFIRETIESIRAQDYPEVEHIVIDGGSTDDTLEVLAGYPHLQVVSESDRGHADAVNKGFRLATGDIWGFLNSDDTLASGALSRVARGIDPSSGRHVVMGRCRFIDERGRFTGFEHPSHFESHLRVLEIWKGHTIPQPAVFWTPDVWRACGPMRESRLDRLRFLLPGLSFLSFSFHRRNSGQLPLAARFSDISVDRSGAPGRGHPHQQAILGITAADTVLATHVFSGDASARSQIL